MIIAAIYGGLGNQMFQYAAARRLALRNRTPLKLHWHNIGTPRKFGLNAFHIVATFATDCEVDALIGCDPFHRIYRRAKYHLGFGNRDPYFWEKQNMPFEPRLLDARHDVYLHGYWQTERYFADVADLIRDEFTLCAPLTENLRAWRNQADRPNSVSLHVRRGDFATSTHRCQYACGVDYYQAAVRRVCDAVPDPQFFMFSDDPGWVRNHLHLDHACTLVSSGETRDYEELTLMSSCRHHIISNSTFGWWGAWLDPRPDKIVIAPKDWYRLGCPHNCADLIPSTWVRL